MRPNRSRAARTASSASARLVMSSLTTSRSFDCPKAFETRAGSPPVAPPAGAGGFFARRGWECDKVEAELEAGGELREKPAGTVRITANDHAADTILWPAICRLLPNYPDVKVEIDVDYGLTDIVADRYDAGVRFGEQVAKDMIAIRIGPDLRMAVVGAPSYFAARPEPKSPPDLVNHNCITFRQPSAGGLYAWAFDKRGR